MYQDPAAAPILLVLSFVVMATGSAISTGNASVTLPTTQCPEVCSCVTNSGLLSVRCQDGDLAETVKLLPSTTHTLRYYLTRDFNEAGVTFAHLGQLKTLVLSSVDTTLYITASTIKRPDIFEGLERLESLSLHVSLVQIEPEALSFVRSLTTLDLSHSRNLRKDKLALILEGIRHFRLPLKKLSIRNFQFPTPQNQDQIIDLREDILRHLDGVSLIELDLSMNGVVVFNPGLVEFLPSLQVIDSSGNIGSNNAPFYQCTQVDILTHPSLRRLMFDGMNRQDVITRFRRDAFVDTFAQDSPCYRQVSSGEYQDIPEEHYVCRVVHCLCSKYTRIHCEYIPTLEQIYSQDEECYLQVTLPFTPEAEIIQFSSQTGILYGNLLGLQYNQTVCFSSNNSLQYFDASNNGLGDSFKQGIPTIKGWNHLWYLNLQNNHAEFKRFDIFKYYTNLTILLLSGNIIHTELDIRSDFFRHNRKLRTLDLANCNIRTIQESQFAELHNLEYLNLSYNYLSTFAVNISRLGSLRLLNLTHNIIETLPHNITSALSKIAQSHDVILDLSQNRLRCNCEDMDFLRWFQNANVKITNVDKLPCSHPKLGSVSVAAINIEELHQFCYPSYTNIIVASVFGTLIIVGIIALGRFAYKRRWTIRFHLHAARTSWVKLIWKEKISNDVSYLYDAFIVYSADDRYWVHETLMKTLESKYGMRLCLHFRDFTPGHYIEDNVIDSINKSKKTVVVLSPNSLNGDWCQFEFRMARHKLVSDGVDVVVLVLLEDLPMEGISKTLARSLQRKTYAQWTENEDGQRLFWNLLVRSIKDTPSEDPEA